MSADETNAQQPDQGTGSDPESPEKPDSVKQADTANGEGDPDEG